MDSLETSKMACLKLGDSKMGDYELGKESFKVVTGDLVTVSITSSITSFASEKRFDKALLVSEVKAKLELICGASAATMAITVFDKDNRKVCELTDDAAVFGSFPIDDGMRLHVEDDSRIKGEFEDVNKVDKINKEIKKTKS